MNWGIIGAGKIAHKFADNLALLSGARLYAVASQSLERARQFQEKKDNPHLYTSYFELVSDPNIDLVYVATPHNFHAEHVRLALMHNKAVLCEKPFTVNAQEAMGLIALARSKHLFLMEAMWTRFLPVIRTAMRWIDEGIIGEPRVLEANFGFVTPGDESHRTLNPDLAGGALLDIGIYPLTLAFLVFREDPVHISSFAHLGKTGVDEQSAYLLGYANGAYATLHSTLRVNTSREARIIGTRGYIHIPLFWRATEASVYVNDQLVETTAANTGLHFQAEHAMDCLRQGLTESPVHSLAETLRMMRLMDGLRASWGLTYPSERS